MSVTIAEEMARRPISELMRRSSHRIGTRTANDVSDSIDPRKAKTRTFFIPFDRCWLSMNDKNVVMAKEVAKPIRPMQNPFLPDLFSQRGSIFTPIIKVQYMRPNIATVSKMIVPLSGNNVVLKVSLRPKNEGPKTIPPCKTGKKRKCYL